MKIFIKKTKDSSPEAIDGEETSYNIPNTTIAWGSLILAIIQALAALLGTYFANAPKQEADKASNKLRRENFQIQMLQRVLESSDSVSRSNSLKLLIASGLLDDANGKITEIAKTPVNVPKWEKHPLELLNGAIETYSSEKRSTPNTLGSGVPPQDINMNVKKPSSPAATEPM